MLPGSRSTMVFSRVRVADIRASLRDAELEHGHIQRRYLQRFIIIDTRFKQKNNLSVLADLHNPAVAHAGTFLDCLHGNPVALKRLRERDLVSYEFMEYSTLILLQGNLARDLRDIKSSSVNRHRRRQKTQCMPLALIHPAALFLQPQRAPIPRLNDMPGTYPAPTHLRRY